MAGQVEGRPAAESVLERSRVTLSAEEWAVQQWAQVRLHRRLTRRAVQIGALMAAHPSESLPFQMGDRAALVGAYRFLDNERVSLKVLLEPHRQQTLAAARSLPLVLFAEDTTELDYTDYPSKTGLGPIGDGRGRGLLLHTTLAIVPKSREVLGVAHAEVALRVPKAKRGQKWVGNAESKFWVNSAEAVGTPPSGVRWVHVSDQGSDAYEYMAGCCRLRERSRPAAGIKVGQAADAVSYPQPVVGGKDATADGQKWSLPVGKAWEGPARDRPRVEFEPNDRGARASRAGGQAAGKA